MHYAKQYSVMLLTTREKKTMFVVDGFISSRGTKPTVFTISLLFALVVDSGGV